MVIRPRSRIERVSRKPWSTAPMRFSSGTSTSSMISSAVSELRMPSFPWMTRWLKPFMCFSSTKAVIPFCAFSGEVRASTTKV
jgi:hypothetical protein